MNSKNCGGSRCEVGLYFRFIERSPNELPLNQDYSFCFNQCYYASSLLFDEHHFFGFDE